MICDDIVDVLDMREPELRVERETRLGTRDIQLGGWSSTKMNPDKAGVRPQSCRRLPIKLVSAAGRLPLVAVALPAMA
jgi:hypothetical protein